LIPRISGWVPLILVDTENDRRKFKVFYKKVQLWNNIWSCILDQIEYINSLTIVGYFYRDGIIKYDGFSRTQVDGTISKETIRLHKDTTQRYLDRLSWLYRLRRSWLYNLLDYLHALSVILLLSFCCTFYSWPFYTQVMPHLRIVDQSLHIIIRFGWIASYCER